MPLGGAAQGAFKATVGGGEVMLVPGANHFSMAHELASADKALCAALLTQMGLNPGVVDVDDDIERIPSD